VQQVPLRIRREIRKYDSDGLLISSLHLPARGFAYIQNDILLKEDGILYHLFSDETGIKLYRWNLRSASEGNFVYTDDFYRFEEITAADHDTDPSAPFYKIQDIQDFPQVTPEEALATGDTYDKLSWTCTNDNITNGQITDSYGSTVETPSWVVPGNLEKVPYKWGGFQTIDQFVSGIAAGKYAGDRYTSKSGGTASAVGVDCSGFVSRCWKLPSHYSTRMMDDAIAQPYDSWEQSRPGDAAHKPGHVRLIVEHNPDGTIKMVEAAGYNWRVSYRSYNLAALGGYTPRYYINMQGTPGNIPQPRLDYVSINNDLNINWNISGIESIAEFKLAESKFADDWTTEYTIENTAQEYTAAIPDGCRFYKLTSISSVAEGAEGLPSDVYGVYNIGTVGKVLIVDGFDRTTANSGSWNHNYHSFNVDYALALSGLNISFESASNDAVLNGTVELEDYKAVIWFVGDESTADETFNNQEQDLVEAYLKQGGYLFATGSEIGWDLDYKGTSTDKVFINNYLKCSYSEDDSKSYTVSGIPGTSFEGITLHYDDGSHGVYEEDYPDVLAAEGGSNNALRYANQKVAAIYYEGMFEGGTKEGKLFIMGFPLETIYEAEERQSLIQKIMQFFEFSTTDLYGPESTVVEDFTLTGNFPNPFNNQTTIRYILPQSSQMTIEVHNSLGQMVFSDHWSSAAGEGSYRFNAAGISSGVYYYKIGSKDLSFRSGKFVLIK